MASIGRCGNLLTHNIARDGRNSFSSGLGVVGLFCGMRQSQTSTTCRSLLTCRTLTQLNFTAGMQKGSRFYFAKGYEMTNITPDHPAANFKQTSQFSRALLNFWIFSCWLKFRPPYFRFNARSRADLGLGIPLFGANLIVAFFREHFVNDAAEVSAQSTDCLIVLLSLASFLFVISLRLRHILSMPIQSGHHGRLSTRVDMLGLFGAVIVAGTIVQGRHAQVQS